MGLITADKWRKNTLHTFVIPYTYLRIFLTVEERSPGWVDKFKLKSRD